ncbi:Transcription factor DIVARICATA [Apostasia shenzhenica]|uniref:Transcription factor MYBS1 n=1 Tax=Apostasia shenzhenica TaxID=1088818 RepID=A0A2I0AKT0_9ASPA|nr:Transcription factor DIVARICATA [Apostasia shenzhenica]
MMTNPWTEVFSPAASYFSDSNWVLREKRNGNWTQLENKLFENALAHFDEGTPDRWEKVAEIIPGKTVEDVISHYQDLEEDVSCIEAGLVPFPVYISSFFTSDVEEDHVCDGLKHGYCIGEKRPGGRLSYQERKKGVPWTEKEHKRFLMGLKKYGKGDWRNISRNFVITRTPTQVASHAQKYFIRLNSASKDKRRASIHDITTVSLDDNWPLSPSYPSVVTMQSSSATSSTSEKFSVVVDSEQIDEVARAVTSGEQFIPSSYGLHLNRNLHHTNLCGCIVGHNGVSF